MNNVVEKYDKFFTENYKYLLSFCKSINPSADYESLCHDCYIRCKERIITNGFVGDGYLNYFRCSAMNLYKSSYRNNKKKQLVDIDDVNYYGTIEEILLQKETQEEQQKEHDNQTIYLNTMIFEYVGQNFTPKEIFIFRTYYILHKRRLNYKILASITGYSITSVSNIIKRMKKNIQENIRSYIITGQTYGNQGKNPVVT